MIQRRLAWRWLVDGNHVRRGLSFFLCLSLCWHNIHTNEKTRLELVGALCLLLSSSAHAVDVFLQVAYVDALTGSPPCATTTTSLSNNADKDSRPNCFRRVASYFLEGECYPRVNNGWTGIGSGKYFALNETHYCRQGFTDQACQTPVDENESCQTLYATGYDAEEDWERFIHRDMCMATATPQGSFTVPVIETRLYGDKTACEARENDNNDATPYLSQRIFMDADACMPGSNNLQDRDDPALPVVADGAFVVYCQDMSRRSIGYSNKECTSQASVPPLEVPEYLVTGCTDSTDPDSTVHLISDCGRPNRIKHHCKSFPSVGFGIDLGSPNPGGNPTMAPSGAAGVGMVWSVGGMLTTVFSFFLLLV